MGVQLPRGRLATLASASLALAANSNVVAASPQLLDVYDGEFLAILRQENDSYLFLYNRLVASLLLESALVAQVCGAVHVARFI